LGLRVAGLAAADGGGAPPRGGKTFRVSGRFCTTTAKSMSTESCERLSATGTSLAPVITAPSGSDSFSNEITWSPLRIESKRYVPR
jgi:hypothetical protein